MRNDEKIIISGEFVRMYEEVIVTCFKVLARYLSRENA